MLSLSRNIALDILSASGDLQKAQKELTSEAKIINGRCAIAASHLVVEGDELEVISEGLRSASSIHAAGARALAVHRTVSDAWNQPSKVKTAIRTHAACEPMTGTCDAILFAPASGIDITPELKEYLVKFRLFEASSQAGAYPHHSPLISVSETDVNEITHWAVADDMTAEVAQTVLAASGKYLENPIGYSRALFSRPPPPLLDTQDEADNAQDEPVVLLPGFIVEYKKRYDKKTQALHQERSYLVSATTMLASLGITNFPIFGLVTSGCVGGLLMAWYSDKRKVTFLYIHLSTLSELTLQKTYIMEHNIRSFDLSIPLEAYHFATVLIRLREHTDKLTRLFAKVVPELSCNVSTLPQWTKKAQVEKGSKGIASPSPSAAG